MYGMVCCLHVIGVMVCVWDGVMFACDRSDGVCMGWCDVCM